MLTRPGRAPGPAWMRYFSEESTKSTDQPRAIPFWIFFLIYMGAILVIAHLATAVLFSGERSYASETQIAGLPLVAYGAAAKGIVAIGGKAIGIVAIGGFSIGVIAIGGATIGVVSLGGLTLGLLALGGVALGWRAIGGMAVGEAALGGLAIGKYAYAGKGVAYGSREASGRQKEQLIG
jgi:hypothetical protein